MAVNNPHNQLLFESLEVCDMDKLSVLLALQDTMIALFDRLTVFPDLVRLLKMFSG